MIEALLQRLFTRQGQIRVAMAEGQPKNWEEYLALVGEYRGLAHAQQEIENLLREERDDE
jgi:hypothetical protein